MAKDNNGDKKKVNVNMPRPSFMWIYGVIGALIIGNLDELGMTPEQAGISSASRTTGP